MASSTRLPIRELRILNAVAEALHSAPDATQALTRTLSLVADLLGLQTGWVWLLDGETQQFYSAAAQNLPPYLQEPVRMTGKSCWCIENFIKGKLTPKNIDVMDCSRLLAAVDADEAEATDGLRSHASIPLYFQGKPLGIMNVAGPAGRKLTRDELRILTTIAYQTGIAIERARLAEEKSRLARAEERSRLAREIHDTLAQGLTAISLHIESALPHLASNPERARERLQRALTMTRESLEDARRSVQDLHAAPLAGKSLPEALGALGRNFASETGIRVHLKVMGTRTLPLRVEAELFRIAQEALTNVRRHSQATDVTLIIHVRPDLARLVLHDNGKGFRPQDTPTNCHGIVGMRERARLMQGSLRLVSWLGRGTTLAVLVPRQEEL